MAIVIRPYRESDRAVLRELTAAAFGGVSIDHNIDRLLGPIAPRDWTWRKGHHVDHDIDAPGGVVAVAEETDRGCPVGYVSMRIDAEAGVGHIPNLAVDGSLRNQGLGRRLLEHALAQFRAAGLAIARIETLEQNAVGQHLYPALGFREVARQIHYALDLNSPRHTGHPDTAQGPGGP